MVSMSRHENGTETLRKKGQKKERVVISTLIGGISGFLGGKVDLAMQCFVDAWMAFPGLLLFNHHVHRGTGSLPDHRRPGGRRRHRRFPNHARRGDRHQRE